MKTSKNNPKTVAPTNKTTTRKTRVTGPVVVRKSAITRRRPQPTSLQVRLTTPTPPCPSIRTERATPTTWRRAVLNHRLRPPVDPKLPRAKLKRFRSRVPRTRRWRPLKIAAALAPRRRRPRYLVTQKQVRRRHVTSSYTPLFLREATRLINAYLLRNRNRFVRRVLDGALRPIRQWGLRRVHRRLRRQRRNKAFRLRPTPLAGVVHPRTKRKAFSVLHYRPTRSRRGLVEGRRRWYLRTIRRAKWRPPIKMIILYSPRYLWWTHAPKRRRSARRVLSKKLKASIFAGVRASSHANMARRLLNYCVDRSSGQWQRRVALRMLLARTKKLSKTHQFTATAHMQKSQQKTSYGCLFARVQQQLNGGLAKTRKCPPAYAALLRKRAVSRRVKAHIRTQRHPRRASRAGIYLRKWQAGGVTRLPTRGAAPYHANLLSVWGGLLSRPLSRRRRITCAGPSKLRVVRGRPLFSRLQRRLGRLKKRQHTRSIAAEKILRNRFRRAAKRCYKEMPHKQRAIARERKRCYSKLRRRHKKRLRRTKVPRHKRKLGQNCVLGLATRNVVRRALRRRRRFYWRAASWRWCVRDKGRHRARLRGRYLERSRSGVAPQKRRRYPPQQLLSFGKRMLRLAQACPVTLYWHAPVRLPYRGFVAFTSRQQHTRGLRRTYGRQLNRAGRAFAFRQLRTRRRGTLCPPAVLRRILPTRRPRERATPKPSSTQRRHQRHYIGAKRIKGGPSMFTPGRTVPAKELNAAGARAFAHTILARGGVVTPEERGKLNIYASHTLIPREQFTAPQRAGLFSPRKHTRKRAV